MFVFLWVLFSEDARWRLADFPNFSSSYLSVQNWTQTTCNNREFWLQHHIFPSVIRVLSVVWYALLRAENCTQTNAVLLSGPCYAVMGTAVAVMKPNKRADAGERPPLASHTDYWAELAEWAHGPSSYQSALDCRWKTQWHCYKLEQLMFKGNTEREVRGERC